jgi:hypothetical protein
MFHPGIINMVAQDLASLRCDLSSYWASDAVPSTLCLCADANGIRDIIENRALTLELSTLARNSSDFMYAIELAEAFLAERLEMETNPDSIFFCEQLIANLQPTGTYFEFFQIPLFENPVSLLQTSHRAYPYAMTLETKELGNPSSGTYLKNAINLRKVIYDESEQLACLASIYTKCDANYRSACDRFGVEEQHNFLTACWDIFRYALGELSSIFRDPSRAAEKEWIGISIFHEASCGNESWDFDLIEQVFVPIVRFNLGRKHEKKRNSILSITINAHAVASNAEVGMRAFLRKNLLFQVAVNNAPNQRWAWIG